MKKLSMGAIGAISTLAIGILFFGYSFEYPYSSSIGPGPGFFAKWISGLLILLSAVYLVEALRGKDKAQAPEKKSFGQILFILIVMSAYVLLLPILGFNVVSTAFMFVLLLKAYPWYLNAGISLASAVGIYFLFSALGVQLPLNALGF